MQSQRTINHSIGDILEFKKPHPCGSYKWKVIKTGVDYKLECVGCQRIIIIPRVEIPKKIKIKNVKKDDLK